MEQEAFLQYALQQEVCIIPSPLYIVRRDFAGCTQLRALRKKGKSKTWRGTYARLNAFDKCEQLDKPKWFDSCRQMPKISGEKTFEEAIPKAVELSHKVVVSLRHSEDACQTHQSPNRVLFRLHHL